MARNCSHGGASTSTGRGRSYREVRPIPSGRVHERASIAFVEHGRIDVSDQAFVLIDKDRASQALRETQIPIGGLACLMLEPGTRITHAAVKLAADLNCLLVWVGAAGVRLYAAGHPGGYSAARLLFRDVDADVEKVADLHKKNA